MVNPTFSVIVPVYNLEDYIVRCIRSLQTQTLTNFEVLLIDDHSTDHSVALMAKTVNHDPRFKIVQQPRNRGVSATRNVGLDMARGHYICFVDGDDWVEPNYLSHFADLFFIHPNIQLAVCGHWGYLSVPSMGKTYNRKKLMSTINFGTVGGFPWNKCFLKSLIDQHHLRFNEDFSFLEDQLFAFEYAVHIKEAHYEPLKTYHYVTRAKSRLQHSGLRFFKARRRLVHHLKNEGIHV